MAGDDSAELVIGDESRRVAMDLVKVDPKSEPSTEIEGEVHDQEDLNEKNATLRIDGVGKFEIRFFTPTRFRGRLASGGN